MTPETKPVKVEDQGSSKGTIIALLLFGIFFPAFTCILSSLFLLANFFIFSSAKVTNSYPDEPIVTVVEEQRDDINLLEDQFTGSYIDPLIDIQMSQRLIDDSESNFYLKYGDTTIAEQYLFERDFILANIQYEYEQLSSRLNMNLSTVLELTLTSSQSEYETELGFRYDSVLPYAGVTKYGTIMILIAPEKDYDKEDLARLLSHELVHAFQFDSEDTVNITAPLWFTEGTAEYFSGAQLYDPTIFNGTLRFPSLVELDGSLLSTNVEEALSSYIVAHHFIEHLTQLMPEEKLISLMLRDTTSETFQLKFTELYGSTPSEIYESWYTDEFTPEWYSFDLGLFEQNLMYNSHAFVR